MNKRYLSAVNALYGTQEPTPHSATISKRSFGKSQKRKPRRNIEQGLQIRLVAWALGEGLDLIRIGNEGKSSRFGGQTGRGE